MSMGQGLPPVPIPVAPNPRAVRTIGILNIVFASILLLFAAVSLVSALASPYYARVLKAQEQATAARDAQSRASAIEEARRREQAAQTPAEQATLKARRQALESAPPLVRMPMTGGVQPMSDPRFAAYTWSEQLTSLALNGAMLAAGIGLLGSRAWARSLALWVAGLKLVRLAILTVVAVAVIAPLMARLIGVQMDQQMAQQQAMMRRGPAPAPPVNFTKFMAITLTAWYVTAGLLGAIYPAVVLAALNRPGAKAACSAGPGPGPDPWS